MEKNKPKFAVDAMLGNIARKLRLLGYDSIYFSHINDEELILIAKKENRILITRDEQLVKNCLKSYDKVIMITCHDELEQFIQLSQNVELEQFTIEGKISRCSICNGLLQPIDRKEVLDKIPKGVLEKTNGFWKCKICKKIYWEGTHIKNLQNFVTKLNQKIRTLEIQVE